MDREIVLQRLKSDNEKDLVEALYAIDECLAQDPIIISLMRPLLRSKSPDVREISIMRLACRSHDGTITDDMKRNIGLDRDLLTFSASVRGLVCLSDDTTFEHSDLEKFLTDRRNFQKNAEKLAVLDQALRDIGRSRKRTLS